MSTTKSANVRLGFEIGSGEPVDIPIRHMVVTGITQESGKTTATEAIISRSGVKALAFLTKRGEGGFQNYSRIEPYFHDQAGWQFTASILEASRGEKLKFERAWIIRASKNATTLKGVQANVRKLMEKAKGMSADVYLTLDAYLEAVVPQIDKVRWANRIDLKPGINVMDLTAINVEMQHLVIKSSLDWVLNHEENTVVVIPEAWKFIPESRGTPVKLSAESYIRQAAGLGNYLFLDSQDIAGISKLILKSVPLWILGVQREANEIKRTLSEIPAGIKKPSPENIAHLELGQFYACWGKHIRHVYVQPSWMDGDGAQKIAMGWRSAGDYYLRPIPDPESVQIDISPITWSQALDQMEAKSGDDMNDEVLHEILDRQTTILDRLTDQMLVLAKRQAVSVSAGNGNGETYGSGQVYGGPITPDIDTLYAAFRERVLKDKAVLIKLAQLQPEIDIETTRTVVQMSDNNLQGWLVALISKGFFDQGATGSAAYTELVRLGKRVAKPGVYSALDKLTEMGAVTKETDGANKMYVRNPDLKISRREKSQ